MTDVYDIYSKGFSYHQQGEFEIAEQFYTQALSLDSNDLNTLYMYANLKFQQLHYKEAEKLIQKALRITEHIQFFDLLTRIRLETKQYKAAIETAVQGLKIDPNNFELNFNIALAFKNHKDYDLALKFYQRAEKLNPTSYLVPFNMASVYFFLNHPQKTKECLEKALSLEPNNDELKYFLALEYFREKNYQKGFPLFESRLCKKTATIFQQKQYPVPFCSSRPWKGEDISDKTVYMYYEAGYGDVIQYARYFPLLRKRCKKLLFKPHLELVELFIENPLGIDELITYKDDNIEFDTYVPMFSVPYLLGLNESNMFVSPNGYIKANEQKKARFKQKYFNNDSIKIGIKWQGNTASETDRVINIEAFEPLFELPNTQFYSFQTGEGSEKLEVLKDKYPIVDISEELETFSDTAAALDNLDYVICNDTSLLHLAGALNKPSFMLLPFDYNWRWHNVSEKCDWYTSVKMYRQKTDGDWTAPMEDLITDFSKLVYSK